MLHGFSMILHACIVLLHVFFIIAFIVILHAHYHTASGLVGRMTESGKSLTYIYIYTFICIHIYTCIYLYIEKESDFFDYMYLNYLCTGLFLRVVRLF